MNEKFNFSDLEPDIVVLVLEKVIEMSPGFSAALAKQIEGQIKEQHGGRRMFVPKGAKRLTPKERQAVFKDGMNNMPTDEIVEKHNIHRATFYRLMKQGGRFSSE